MKGCGSNPHKPICGNMGCFRDKKLRSQVILNQFHGASSEEATRMGCPCLVHSPDCLRGRRWGHRELLHPTRLQCDRCRCASLLLIRAAINRCLLAFRDVDLYDSQQSQKHLRQTCLWVWCHRQACRCMKSRQVCCPPCATCFRTPTLPATPTCMVHLSTRSTGGGHWRADTRVCR